MHEKCVRFVVEYCRDVCPEWSKCIATSMGFENGDPKDMENLLFCLKSIENPDKSEEEIEQLIKGVL